MKKISAKKLKERFGFDTRVVPVPEWGGEVTIRQLSVGERAHVNEIMFRDAEPAENGKLRPTLEAFTAGRIQAVAYALTDPEMTADELRALGGGAIAGINTIGEALEELDRPKKPPATNGGSSSTESPGTSEGP